MDVTLHQLRLLTQVRSHGTISSAANAVHITPSAASQQLAALEAAVGTPMLRKVGRGVQLTEAGLMMAQHADLMLRQLEAARADMEQLRDEVRGTLRLSVLESLTSSILPRLLSELSARYPGLELRTYQADDEAGARVLSGELDGAFVVGYPDAPVRRDEGLLRHHLCRDWFKIVVPFEHPLEGPVVDMEALNGLPMISSPLHLSCGRCVVSACRSAGFEPNVTHEIGDYPAALNLVAAGAGVALIPDLGLLHPRPGIRVLEPSRRICRHVDFVVRRASGARPSVRAFLEVLDLVAERAGLDRDGKGVSEAA